MPSTYRDVAVRFVAANLHPDHDTVATFRRTNTAAIEATFLHALLLACDAGLLRLGSVSIDVTGSKSTRPGSAPSATTVRRRCTPSWPSI